MEDRKTEMINLVMRQTNYDKDVIIEKLEVNNNNYLAVIKEYIMQDKKEMKKEENKSTNQKIMSEIRTFMDDVNNQHAKRKRYNERMIYYQQLQAEKNTLRAAQTSGIVDVSENSIVSGENSAIKKNEHASIIPEKQ
tara:strand:+ start:122 stop:532 length:411 start_codon:yes stop_codon:yes gene_type:complete